MHLPLARLELTRAARHKSIHWLRFVAPTVCAAALLLAWFIMSMGGAAIYETANLAGSFLTNTVFGFLLFTVCVLTPLFASSTIASEKQERSLGLLLLTNIRGRDLFIAKGLTVFLQVELLVLGCLPLQAIASLLGGLSLQMLIGQQIAAASLCLIVASLGLLCSSLASRVTDAFLATIGTMVVWFIAASFADTMLLAPIGLRGASGLSVLASTLQPSFLMKDVLLNAAYSLGLALVVGSVVWYRLPRLTDDAAKPMRAGRSLRRYGRWLDRIRYLRLGPVDRLYAAAAAGAGGALYRWPWAPLVVLITVIVSLIPNGLVGLPITLLIIYDGVSCITSVRQTGGTDALYLTSATDRQIARGIHRTHLRRALLFLPAMLTSDVSTYVFMFTMINMQSSGAWDAWLAFASLLIAVAGSFVSLYAFTCLGCGASTWKGTPGMLTFKAILALFGAYLVGYMISMAVMIAVQTTMFLGTSPSSAAMVSFTMIIQVVMLLPITLTLLGFAVTWQGRFRQTLAQRWRTGAEA